MLDEDFNHAAKLTAQQHHETLLLTGDASDLLPAPPMAVSEVKPCYLHNT